ncbi:HAMP domain-containing protein [Novosphingobium sp. FSY-8]|uniref:histidine kinase n=1 Tax=Novosphingobium ovatum TaxID=1908523 RepID=A0ABW9XHU9_9SPHN|nr:ATP-binding protein [Novosphingobium ovatum]NBC38120.1 HAMP domain-containing protein [Novosphingobium ovatum]
MNMRRQPRFDLSRHLTLAMAMVAVGTVVFSFLAFYVAYTVAIHIAPQLFPPDYSALPSGWDLAIMGVVTAMGIALSGWLGLRISRCIVLPMHEVARAARAIADGDLSARANPVLEAPGETAMLVADFNTMAARLEKGAHNAISWNAQIAHELRTPLTILKGRLQGVSDGVFAMDEALLRGLLSQVDGLARLVEDLRCVSLADIGRLELRLTDVDLTQELAEWAALMQPTLTKAQFGLHVSCPPVIARLDAGRLRQALLALLDNALHYAHPCTLRLEAALGPNGLEIALGDQGPGVPEAQVEALFEVFSRGASAQNTHRTGSGLGLAVVQAIASAHGGKAAYHRDGTQSRFLLLLPQPALVSTFVPTGENLP